MDSSQGLILTPHTPGQAPGKENQMKWEEQIETEEGKYYSIEEIYQAIKERLGLEKEET